MSPTDRVAAVRALRDISLLLQLKGENHKPGAVTSARLESFARHIAAQGVAPNRLPLFSAHQMGTCRLGADRATSVAEAGPAIASRLPGRGTKS